MEYEKMTKALATKEPGQFAAIRDLLTSQKTEIQNALPRYFNAGKIPTFWIVTVIVSLVPSFNRRSLGLSQDRPSAKAISSRSKIIARVSQRSIF
jgi:hypothetical protein